MSFFINFFNIFLFIPNIVLIFIISAKIIKILNDMHCSDAPLNLKYLRNFRVYFCDCRKMKPVLAETHPSHQKTNVSSLISGNDSDNQAVYSTLPRTCLLFRCGIKDSNDKGNLARFTCSLP